jgi:anti-sigma factor ChrR (cupin superfamily)
MVMDESLNADFTKRAVMETAAMAWQASPSPTVWRKRLDLVAGEFSRVTSVVRYDAESAFHPHDHPDGEEILVLDGVFSDEHGDYPAGSYLLNPEGFRHAPFSRRGCVLFVKLRQYGGARRRHRAIDTSRAAWLAGEPGVEVLPLYLDANHTDIMMLQRYAPGTRLAALEQPGGLELFVLEGALQEDGERHGAGTWIRLPPGSRPSLGSSTGCKLYLKVGHLAPVS